MNHPRPRATILFALFLVFSLHSTFAQKVITSKVMYSKTPFDSVYNSDYAYTIEYTREITLLKNDNCDLKIKRIRQISNSPLGEMSVDTDSPFATTQLSKSATEHYMQFIDKPIALDFNSSSFEEKQTVNKLWLANLPVLQPINEFSGVFLDSRLRNEEVLIDTIKLDDKYFINAIRKAGRGKVHIEGIEIPISEILTQSSGALKNSQDNGSADKQDGNMKIQVNALPEQGETLIAQSSGKKQSYSFTVFYNQDNYMIKYMYGEIEKSETFTIMGQKKEIAKTSYCAIINEVK